nr:hypothetical protein [Lentzea sp. NBRC 105346]
MSPILVLNALVDDVAEVVLVPQQLVERLFGNRLASTRHPQPGSRQLVLQGDNVRVATSREQLERHDHERRAFFVLDDGVDSPPFDKLNAIQVAEFGNAVRAAILCFVQHLG